MVTNADEELSKPEAVNLPDDRFEKLVTAAHRIKNKFVYENREWYRKHRLIPLFLFRGTGSLTIVLGVTLPAIALMEVPHKNIILSIMSITIAALTGLSSFFRWERSWRGRCLSQSSIDVLIARWELELENARLILSADEGRQHVYRATRDLISNFRKVSEAEAEEFFSGLQFPQSDPTSKGT